MKGYRTVAVNVLALVYLLLPVFGMDVPVPEQEAITAGVIAVINVFMRMITTTRVGHNE